LADFYFILNAQTEHFDADLISIKKVNSVKESFFSGYLDICSGKQYKSKKKM